ncbi:MAG: tetratricopeptide repeat protein [Treponema sp.]|jgi:tetratricopeptide (TPR) repeat protein|nr:tetratricopeptide repeat protein [Treponema sp.]
MKIKKDIVTGIIAVAVIGLGIYGFYRYDKSKSHGDLARRIAEISPRGGPPETIEGLKAAIALYEGQIELNIKEAGQTGVYWKILATRYADRGMHSDALYALEQAIRYNAEDPALYYLTGVSAAIAAKSSLDFPGAGGGEASRVRYFALAEDAYRRAIALDESYARPRYGLGILYVFELERPAEAIPHLERYLQLMSSDVNAMFALARAFYETGRNTMALELYDRIISVTKDQAVREEARKNREIVLGSVYD